MIEMLGWLLRDKIMHRLFICQNLLKSVLRAGNARSHRLDYIFLENLLLRKSDRFFKLCLDSSLRLLTVSHYLLLCSLRLFTVSSLALLLFRVVAAICLILLVYTTLSRAACFSCL